MTEENYNYRTNELFLRNQFEGAGEFNIPIIPKIDFSDEELKNLLLIGFDKALSDKNHYERIVHFFLYDYKFEKLWKKPDQFIDKLKNYKAVLSPDFSMYIEMNRALQLYNTFRNRWCGAYLADKGIKVIPTVNWGNEDTFDFCFDGIPKGSIVAVSTYMVHEHNHHSDQKEFFMKGYNEMMKRIEPKKIICYSEPFEEMRGDIIYVDYEMSGWKYLNSEKNVLPKNFKNGIIVHKTYTQPPEIFQKGTGSAYGGKWKPKNENDKKFFGTPNTINVTYSKKGDKYEYLIGNEGRAVKVRHNTDHMLPKFHSNPHDHEIRWDNPDEHPEIQREINYFDGNIPELKSFGEISYMKVNKEISYEPQGFETISEFKWCIKFGGEVVLKWKDNTYSITHPQGKLHIGAGCYQKGEKYFNMNTNQEYSENDEMWADTVDEILDFNVNGDRLRDIITQVEIIERTL